jgi:hypothetical protein
MATYKQIQERVRAQNKFVPKTCWIAHVMSDHGLTTRTAANRMDDEIRTNPCPPGRERAAIESPLRHFGMIGPKSN